MKNTPERVRPKKAPKRDPRRAAAAVTHVDSDLRAGAVRPRGGGVIAGERVAHTELKRRRRPRKASRGKTDNWCVRAGRATLRGLRGSSLGLADCGLLTYLCFSAFQLGGGGGGAA